MFNKIPQPKITLQDVFDSLEKISSPSDNLKVLLAAETKDILLKLEKRYSRLENDYELISPGDASKRLTKDQGISLYKNNFSNRIVDDEQIFRTAIRQTAVKLHDRCPFCGGPVPKTIEHVLPKSIFPDLALTPINLVPMCMHCNHEKLANLTSFHPYFEDLSALPGLRIQVDFSKTLLNVPAISFSFETPGTKLEEYFYLYEVDAVALSDLSDAFDEFIWIQKERKDETKVITESDISKELQRLAYTKKRRSVIESRLYETLNSSYLSELTNYLNK